MRHIPEEELHAYLDQALSRLQCVEIERHLASCARCRGLRDGIAALRDRTTALLDSLSPRAVFPPAFDLIRQRAGHRIAVRRRAVRIGWWAAGLAVAAGLAWWGRQPARQGGGQPAVTSTGAPVRIPGPAVGGGDTARQIVLQPVDPVRRPVARVPTSRRGTGAGVPGTRPEPSPRTGSDSAARFPLSGTDTPTPPTLDAERQLVELRPENLWRLVSQADAEAEAGAPLAAIPGLPVVQVKIQGVRPNERIVAVDQQLPDGQVVRTAEGPASQMTGLLARDGQRTLADNVLSNQAAQALEALMTMRFGDRMLIMRGPVDSLRALMSRIAIPRQ